MGIDNLLCFIKPALKDSSIVNYRGKTAAVDAMSWLYKGCYSCAVDLNQNVQTNDFLYFVQKMIQMLQEYQITPVMVFDGRKLKAKERTEQIRKQLKVQNITRAQELIDQGKENEANKYFQRALKITKQMLYITFDVLRELGVKYIIAPYEADSEIAHLCLTGQCDFAITEDSDLICYLCPVIVFKLKNDGSCVELELERLRENRENRQHIDNEDVRVFFSLDVNQIVDVCIMSGCDYLPSIKGIGIRKAVEYMNQLSNVHNIIQKLKKHKSYSDKIPQDYERMVASMRLIFQFQTVYDPMLQQQIQLNQATYDVYIEQLRQANEEQMSPNSKNLIFNENEIQQLIGEQINANLWVPFSDGNLDFKTLQIRERPKVDFLKIFQKFERKSQNTNRIIDTTQTQANIQLLKQLGQFDRINTDDVEQVEHQSLFLKIQQVNKKDEVDIFDQYADMFEQNQELEKQQQLEQQEQIQSGQQQEQEYELDKSVTSPDWSPQVNPFAKVVQIDIKNQLCQIKPEDLINRSQMKNDSQTTQKQNRNSLLYSQSKSTLKPEKVLKQTQSNLMNFVKK